MQVETEDFILSLTSEDVGNCEQTNVETSEVSDLPPDLANTDVSDLVCNIEQGFSPNLEFQLPIPTHSIVTYCLNSKQNMYLMIQTPSGYILSTDKQPFTLAWIRWSFGNT